MSTLICGSIAYDSIMVFEFGNEIVNLKLDESMFEFKAPPGAEVLSEQEIGGED